MSFTITTDVFCDDCGNWMSGPGGIVSNKVEKRRAWKKAVTNGWKRAEITYEMLCPRCVEKIEKAKCAMTPRARVNGKHSSQKAR